MRNALYYAFMFTALVLCVIITLFVAPKYKIKRWKITVICLLCFVYNWGVSYLAAWVEAGFQPFPSVNGARAWIYAPIFFWLCSLIFNVKFNDIADVLAPVFVFGFAFGHIGCVIDGCCHGYPYEGPFAIYNPVLECNVFPTQILESILLAFLFAAFIIYMKKKNWKTKGAMYPWMLIAYTGRFFIEFLRDNEKIWLGCSSLSFHALVGGIVGLIWLLVLNKINKRKEIKSAKEKAFEKTEISKEIYNKLKKKEMTLLALFVALTLLASAGFIIWFISRIGSVWFEVAIVGSFMICMLALFAFAIYKFMVYFNNIEQLRDYNTQFLFFVTSKTVLQKTENKYYMFKTDRKLTLKTYNNELEESEAK